MNPFEEELYRLLQDLRNNTNPFTSTQDDASNDIQAVLEFSKKWNFKDRYLRSAADYDNLLKRTEREKTEWSKTLVLDVLKEMVPVIDTALGLHHHLQNPNSNVSAETVLGAVQMISGELVKVLERRSGGLILPRQGDEFDTEIHRAIDFTKSDTHQGHLVDSVFRCGYRIAGKIIRPAEVRVSLGRSASDSTNSSPAT